MFNVCLKQFLKDKWNVIILFLLLAGQILFVGGHMHVPSVDGPLYWGIVTEFHYYMMPTDKIAFIVFLALAYRYIKKINITGIKDVIELSITGRVKLILTQVSVLVVIAAGYTAALWGDCVVVAARMGCAYYEYAVFMIRAFTLYFFMFLLLAAVIGSLAAFFKNPYQSYIFLGLVILLFCSGISNTLFKYFASGKNSILYVIGEMAQVYARSTAAISDFEYIMAVEPVNWWKTLFWILLFGIFLLQRITAKKKKAVAAGVMFILTCFDLYLYHHAGMTYYAWELWDSYDSMASVQNYYNPSNPYLVPTMPDNTYAVLLETVDVPHFKITDMTLDIETKRELKATAQLKVDTTDVDCYYFTLVHSYEVDAVTDGEGNALPYERMSDYIRVDNTVKTDTVVMKYHGNNELHLVNSDVIDLPPNFAWYPQAGVRRVYDETLECYAREVQEELIKFHVTVDSRRNVVSNLETVGTNCFAGTAQGCLLFWGLCLEEFHVEQSRIVYPRLGYSREEIVDCFYQLQELYSEAGYDIRGKDWYIIPMFGVTDMNTAFYMDDCIVGQFLGLEGRLKYEELEGKIPYPCQNRQGEQ